MRLRTTSTKLTALAVLLTLAGCATGLHHAPSGRVTENAQEPAISPSRRTQEVVPQWRLSGPVADDDELAGYTTSESVLPGEPIQLKVDSPRGAVEIQVLRMGFYGIDGARTVAHLPWQEGVAQPPCSMGPAAFDPVQGAGTTDLFRYPPDPRPESRLLGAEYACLGTYQDMTIVEESFWAFEGTGAARNQTYPRLVGGEVDAVTTHSPSGAQVVAHSPYRCTDGSGSASDVTYYTAPSRAGVFNAGTFGWTNALTYGTAAPAESIIFVEHVVSTLVREAALGPLGLRHPSEPNVDRYLPR